jgi:hypothetical protein
MNEALQNIVSNGFLIFAGDNLWQFVKSADSLFDCIIIQHSRVFPFWGVYPAWAWLHFVVTQELIRDRTVWHGRN